MDKTMIIIRYADGAVGLTGWGLFWLLWIGVMILLGGVSK